MEQINGEKTGNLRHFLSRGQPSQSRQYILRRQYDYSKLSNAKLFSHAKSMKYALNDII